VACEHTIPEIPRSVNLAVRGLRGAGTLGKSKGVALDLFACSLRFSRYEGLWDISGSLWRSIFSRSLQGYETFSPDDDLPSIGLLILCPRKHEVFLHLFGLSVPLNLHRYGRANSPSVKKPGGST